MRGYSLTKKILSLCVVVALLSLRLGSLTDEIFATPIEDAIFDCAFVAEENHTEGKSIKAKPKRMFEILLSSIDALYQPARCMPPFSCPVGSPRIPFKVDTARTARIK